MKKRSIIIIGVLLFVLLIVTAVFVNSTRQTISFPLVYFDRVRLDTFQYNSCVDKSFGINVNIISKNNDNIIEYVCATGQNTDSLSVSINDYTPDGFKNKKVMGCSLQVFGLVFETTTDKVQIDSITLKIGEDQKIFELPDPVCFELVDETDNSVDLPVIATEYPFLIQESDIIRKNNQTNQGDDGFTFSYLVVSEKEVTLTDFEFNNFLVPIGAKVFLNTEEIGTLDSCLPLKVKKDDVVSILCNIGYKEGIDNNDFGNTYCDAVVSGYIDDENDNHSSKAHITCYGIMNWEKAEQFIKNELKRIKD